MANERAYLVCMQCLADPAVAMVEECICYLTKYYPTTGWYTSGNPETLGDRLDTFYDAHQHKTLFGMYLRLAYEMELFDVGLSKAEILERVSQARQKAIKGDTS